MEMSTNKALRLNGEWVGEAVVPSPATWHMHMQGMRATLMQLDADHPQFAAHFECTLSGTPAAFTLGEPCDEFIGIVLDECHLIIAGLDDGRDVIFSRPGLAELTAHETYASAIHQTAQMRFAITRWAAA